MVNVAKHKSKSEIKERFVLELPLKCEPWQRDRLDRTFNAGNHIKNALIAKKKRALNEMTRTRKWNAIQSELSAIYEKYGPDLKALSALAAKAGRLEKQGKPLPSEEALQMKRLQTKKNECDKLIKPWFKHRKDILEQYGMSEYDFHCEVKRMQHHYKGIIGSHVAQKIATDVWKTFSGYLFGTGKNVTFSKWTDFTSIEGKNNATNIVFDRASMCVRVGKMSIAVRGNKRDPYGYETEALSRRVCYCRIVRKAYPSGWGYSLQLVLEGNPPIKKKPGTGEPLHPIGKGRVGLDIGTQTLAACADGNVMLDVLASGAQNLENELRRVNRAMDRSRRATNPKMFHPNGTIVTIDKLPPECLNKRGQRAWRNSKRYEALARYRRYLYRKQAELRKRRHREMANRLLGWGSDFLIEKMNFRALAKKAKPQRKEDLKPGEKFKRRKRFGRSIANRAPALFVQILKGKVLSAGGSFSEIDTWNAKASQFNHMTGKYTKKKLSQRVNIMPGGRRIQRDLYSAFLIQHTNSDLKTFNRAACFRGYKSFVRLHDAEMRRINNTQCALPSSMGRGKIA